MRKGDQRKWHGGSIIDRKSRRTSRENSVIRHRRKGHVVSIVDGKLRRASQENNVIHRRRKRHGMSIIDRKPRRASQENSAIRHGYRWSGHRVSHAEEKSGQAASKYSRVATEIEPPGKSCAPGREVRNTASNFTAGNADRLWPGLAGRSEELGREEWASHQRDVTGNGERIWEGIPCG
jgi:hypothetical protein